MQRARGLGEIVLGDLEIVPVSHGRCVADPRANDVRGTLGFQFCLPAGSHVVRDAWPLNQAGFLDDPSQVRSQVLRRCSLAMDDKFLSRLRFIKGLFKEWSQFGEQRNDP